MQNTAFRAYFMGQFVFLVASDAISLHDKTLALQILENVYL